MSREPNWKKIVDNLLERNSNLTLEHAAMKALASDLETERDMYKQIVEDNDVQQANNVPPVGEPSQNGHGHGHTEIRVAAPDDQN